MFDQDNGRWHAGFASYIHRFLVPPFEQVLNLPGVVDLSLGGKKQVRVPRAVFQDFLESRKVQPTG